MFVVNSIPKIVPSIVPDIPIIEPTIKKILKTEISLVPIVFNTAISFDFVCTRMNKLVITLNAAIIIIKDKTKNINSRSVANTSQKELFNSIQSLIM